MDTDLAEPAPYLATMQLVESYAEVDEILKSPDFLQGSHRETAAFLEGSLVMTDGADHLERRRMLSALVSRAALEYYELEALRPLIGAVIAEAGRGEDGVMRGDVVSMVNIMLHRITAAVVGIDGVVTPEDTERFRALVKQVGIAVSSEWTAGDRDAVIREGLRIRDKLVADFVRPSWDKRAKLVARHQAGELAREGVPTDLLTILLLHWKPDWTEDYVWREATLFLVAAIETTTHLLPHVVKEIEDWIATHPEDRARRDDPEFLWAAVNEAARLHVPVPSLQRSAARDTTLSTGRSFRAGDRVALLFGDANRDTALYGADAASFNPHRKVTERVRPWGLTFGGGAHLCMGRPLVTGLSRQTGDESNTTQGTAVRILRALYGAGMELDPAHPPVRNSEEYRGYFSSLPIILRRA